MRNSSLSLRAGLLLAVILGLAACHDDDDLAGGGSGTPPPPPPPPPGLSVGDTLVITANPRVISFNRASPATTRTSKPVTGLLTDETLVGADYRPVDGKLYAVLRGPAGSRVALLDPATGALSVPVSLSVALDPEATAFGVDFNPVPDRLRVVSSTGQNLRINVVDGVTAVDGTLKLDRRTATTTDISGISGAAYSNSFKEACRTTLYYLNSSSDMLLTSADPNAGTVFNVGSLGLDAGEINGFDVVTGTGTDGLPTNIGMAVLSSGGGAPTLFSIDLGTGAATAVGAIAGLSAGEQLVTLTDGIAPSPTKQARGELAVQTASNKLLTINRGAPAKACTGPVAVSGLNADENLVGIDTRPATGELVGLSDDGRLLVLDPLTGAASVPQTLDVGLPAGEFSFGVDFNPVPDRLRVVGGAGQNQRINPNVAPPTNTSDIALSGTSTVNVTAVAYSNSVKGADAGVNNGGSTTLFGIDTTRNVLVRIGGDPASGGACTPPPADAGNPNCGVVTDVGSGLGFNPESTNGFDIDGVNGAALFAAHEPGDATAKLYTVNLSTGAATLVTTVAASSTIAGGEHVRGMALLPVSTATVFALLENGSSLVSFLPSGLATPSAPIAITGLAASETLLDIDFRVTGNGRRNRQLVGISNQSRLYVIDPATGAATQGQSLKDSGNAAVALDDTTITGVDFNPVPDLLRVITGGDQNLRINVDTAVAALDSSLSNTVVQPYAAAYSNSFVGSTSTTLYAIDFTTANLLRIGGDPATGGACTPPPADAGNPNCGVVTFIGAGVAAPPLSGLGDMDIVGGRNGYALAAVQSIGGGPSRLVRINLGTGAGTSLGDIGGASGTPVRSLAVRLQ
ncbi:MAG TPA: DUF4394 domain-containing protein [Solimonas sp.]|nr:DUF4394 domain-containing protein [Solimonas sp.]